MNKFISLVCILSVFILISPTVFSVETANLENFKKTNILNIDDYRCGICSASEKLNKKTDECKHPIKTIVCDILFCLHCIFCILRGKVEWVTFISACILGCGWANMIP